MAGTGTLAPNPNRREARLGLPMSRARGYGGGQAVGSTSTGGISAVNPQATADAFGNVDKYIEDSYNNAMTRLKPQMEASRNAAAQALVDRGIGVGTEAYDKAMAQQSQYENDAQQNARFMAQQQGSALQNQMFQQELARSQLANSLLQGQMQQKYGYDSLAEQARQFNFGHDERVRQFTQGLREQQRQFDDQSNQQWDDRAFRDLSWLDQQNFRNRQYNDSRDDLWFNMRQALLGAIPGWNPAQIDVNGAANSATNSQQAAFDAGMAQDQAMWNNIGTAAGAMMAFSDPALKADVKRIGTVNGFNWYRWNWNDLAGDLFGLKGESEGVMADEVPAEMTGMRDGFLTVDYARVMA